MFFSHLTSMPTEVFYLVASALFAPLSLFIGFSMNIVTEFRGSFGRSSMVVLFRVLGVVLVVLCVGQVLRVVHMLLFV
jgi:hypothetical protein